MDTYVELQKLVEDPVNEKTYIIIIFDMIYNEDPKLLDYFDVILKDAESKRTDFFDIITHQYSISNMFDYQGAFNLYNMKHMMSPNESFDPMVPWNLRKIPVHDYVPLITVSEDLLITCLKFIIIQIYNLGYGSIPIEDPKDREYINGIYKLLLRYLLIAMSPKWCHQPLLQKYNILNEDIIIKFREFIVDDNLNKLEIKCIIL